MKTETKAVRSVNFANIEESINTGAIDLICKFEYKIGQNMDDVFHKANSDKMELFNYFFSRKSWEYKHALYHALIKANTFRPKQYDVILFEEEDTHHIRVIEKVQEEFRDFWINYLSEQKRAAELRIQMKEYKEKAFSLDTLKKIERFRDELCKMFPSHEFIDECRKYQIPFGYSFADLPLNTSSRSVLFFLAGIAVEYKDRK